MLPHGPGMCLIDRVLQYNSDRILCEIDSHLSSNHPLRYDGKLSSIILIEYAAQASAIHAILNQQTIEQNQTGYIGLIKNIKLHARYLHDIHETLTLQSRCLLCNVGGAIYEFKVTHSQPAAEGQINILLPAQ